MDQDEKLAQHLIEYRRALGNSAGDAWQQEERINEAIRAIHSYIATEYTPRPATLMGKPLEEVMQILTGLELERIADIQMTMARLNEWMEYIREDMRAATQKALDRAVSDAVTRAKNHS